MSVAELILKEEPVLEHFLAIGGEDTLRMELDTSDIEGLVTQGHYLTFVADGSDFEAIGEVLIRHHPRVVASDGDIPFDAAENRIVGDDMAGGGDTATDSPTYHQTLHRWPDDLSRHPR